MTGLNSRWGSRICIRDIAVHQLASDCGSGGRWFESTQLYQQNQNVKSGYGMPFFVRVRAMSAIALQVEGYGSAVTGMI